MLACETEAVVHTRMNAVNGAIIREACLQMSLHEGCIRSVRVAYSDCCVMLKQNLNLAALCAPEVENWFTF